MKKYTYIFIAVMVLVIAVYDIIAIYFGGTESSISSILIVYSYKFPAGTFLIGFVAGHLFWRMKSNKDTAEIDKGH